MKPFSVSHASPTPPSGPKPLVHLRASAGSAPAARTRNRAGFQLCCGLLASTAIFGVPASGAAAVLIPGDQAGTFAQGSITSRFIICSTCTPASDVLSNNEDGGIGSNGPAIVHDGVRVGTGSADYEARAIIFG